MSISPVNRMVIDLAITPDHQEVCVRITGDVDIVCEADLAHLSQRLIATGCAGVYIDLAGITFAGATLINFVFGLCTRLPEDAFVILCRPESLVQRMIKLTALDQYAAVRGDLPPGWTMPPARADESSGSLATV